MSQDIFMNRHIGPTDSDVQEMLNVIGVSSVEELISQVIPANIRLPELLKIENGGMSEYEYVQHISELSAMNKPMRTFIGMGYYGTAVVPAILRNVLENPNWYTSYTPYQAEVSQGRLEALLNFQTMVCSLTGMEICNCSMLDEGTSAAESMTMMHYARSRQAVKEQRNTVFVDKNIFPQTLDVIYTRGTLQGIDIVVEDFSTYEFKGNEFGAILQYPAADGSICDYEQFTTKAHENGAMVTAVADLLALALIKSPAEWGADIVAGYTQRFGIPMGLGGPAAGYIAAKSSYKRMIPGRIIGVTVDRLGNKALRLALQSREQHIKRDKATSNICTASALMAVMAGMYGVYHGPKGIKRIAMHIHSHAVALAGALKGLGYELSSSCFFDTIEVTADEAKVKQIALAKEVNLAYTKNGQVRISMDEIVTLAEVNNIISIFAEAAGVDTILLNEIAEVTGFCPSMTRQTPFMEEDIFSKMTSETDLMRYIHTLVRRDISLTNSMIPLGSCTMKLNPAATVLSLSMGGFGNVHPFVPACQREGYNIMNAGIEKDLAEITGFAAVSNQPTSGASGEYAALTVIRNWHNANGGAHRNIMLIPASAHGTNPATATMVGLNIIIVNSDDKGNIDVQDFVSKAEANKDNLFGAMITYPSTHGVFEQEIRAIVDSVHANGGQVFMDGANMNGQIGLTSPGFIGADACHLNLHKSFCMPHGGGGPGVGTIGVAKHLVDFLPTSSVVEGIGGKGGSAVSSAPWGNALLLPITYGYIKMLGAEGLKKSTELAIVNSNYMACSLQKEFNIVFTGATGRVGHELILDYRNYKKDYGIESGDIARRLMDYGFHAPTLSFPVHETLMIEPTESEPLAEMDRYIETLISIKRECEELANGTADAEDSVIKNAPHTCFEATANDWNHKYSREQAVFPLAWIKDNKFWPYVTKVDNGFGDRNLVCACSIFNKWE